MLRNKTQLRPPPLSQKRQVRPRRGVRDKVLDGRVGGQHPALAVLAEAVGVILVHLDEVLVEAVGAASPSAVGINKLARLEVDVGPEQAGERLAQRPLRPQEIRLAPLRQLRVLGIISQVAEARPFQHQRADGGDAVCGLAHPARRVEVEVVVWDPAGRVEGDLEVVGQAFGLREDGVHPGRLGDVSTMRAREEVVG